LWQAERSKRGSAAATAAGVSKTLLPARKEVNGQRRKKGFCTATCFPTGFLNRDSLRTVLYTGSACVLVSVTRASVRRREADALTELSASAERELLKVLKGTRDVSPF
jgi:hypothetical protein